VAAPSPEGGSLSRGEGNGDRGARHERVWSCAARSSWARTGSQWSRTQAEVTRNERHRESDERQQRRGRKDKKGETGDDMCTGNTIAQMKEKEDISSGNGGTGGSSDQQWRYWQCRAGQGDWRRREGGGSDLVQLGLRANGYLLCLRRRSALT
jgi:hypothetical protein